MDLMYTNLANSATEELIPRFEKQQTAVSKKSAFLSKKQRTTMDYRSSYTEEVYYESEAPIENRDFTFVQMKKNLTAKFRRLLRHDGGDVSETEPLISKRTRANRKSFIFRDKMKTVGKRFRKAMESSLSYMAAGMATDVMTASLLSGYLPNPTHYCSNCESYYSCCN